MKAIVQINRPELTVEERAKRMEEIKLAATKLLIANEKRQQTARK